MAKIYTFDLIKQLFIKSPCSIIIEREEPRITTFKLDEDDLPIAKRMMRNPRYKKDDPDESYETSKREEDDLSIAKRIKFNPRYKKLEDNGEFGFNYVHLKTSIDDILKKPIPKKMVQDYMTPKKPTLLLDNVSPFTIDLVSRLNPEEAAKYIKDYLQEKKYIEIIEKGQADTDPDYKYTSNTEVGAYVELWVCANMKCPICNGELVKYTLLNMPVIDIKCINSKHKYNMGPKFFQIKATEQNNAFPYFTLNPFLNNTNGFIVVGSRRLGELSHSVKPSDSDKQKQILIGYICLTYKYSDTTKRNIRLTRKQSFILIPQITVDTKIITDANDYYYKYVDNIYKKPVITFNEVFVKVILFSNMNDVNFKKQVITDNAIIINLDIMYSETIITDNKIISPPIKKLVLKNKYDIDALELKLKYLLLKNNNIL